MTTNRPLVRRVPTMGLLALLAAAGVLLIWRASPASAEPRLGGQLFGTGGEVTVEVLPAEANDTSELRLCQPGSPQIFLATNRDVGTVVNLGVYPQGTELVFCIYNRDHGWTFFMGPASRNPDNIEHAIVDVTGPGTAHVGFEDVLGGFDRDFDDNTFLFTGVVSNPPVANPDPYSTDEDVPLTVGAPGVLANDKDAEGDALGAAVVSSPANGTVTLSADGSFVYAPNANWHGTDSFTYKANDGRADSNVTSVTIEVRPVNDPPTCAAVSVDTPTLWPPNHQLGLVTVSGATDVDGDQVTIVVTRVTQDEPLNGLGDGDAAPDAVAARSANQVFVRAERSGTGDGRVYMIEYVASDGEGVSCSGSLRVAAPHDQRARAQAIDSGQTVDSFGI